MTQDAHCDENPNVKHLRFIVALCLTYAHLRYDSFVKKTLNHEKWSMKMFVQEAMVEFMEGPGLVTKRIQGWQEDEHTIYYKAYKDWNTHNAFTTKKF